MLGRSRFRTNFRYRIMKTLSIQATSIFPNSTHLLHRFDTYEMWRSPSHTLMSLSSLRLLRRRRQRRERITDDDATEKQWENVVWCDDVEFSDHHSSAESVLLVAPPHIHLVVAGAEKGVKTCFVRVGHPHGFEGCKNGGEYQSYGLFRSALLWVGLNGKFRWKRLDWRRSGFCANNNRFCTLTRFGRRAHSASIRRSRESASM